MKQYSEQFDAYYDDESREWLDSQCDDPECAYCTNRPDRAPEFKEGDRVYVAANKMEATVIKQQLSWDYPDCFWGNVELLYDDGVKGVSNSWQVVKV